MLTPTPAKQCALANASHALRSKGRSFYWAGHLLSKLHAARATRLYGFCRHVDDLADEATSVEDAQHALAMLSADIGAGRSDDPATRDVLDLMAECRIEVALMLELIRGVASDLEPVRIADDDALLRYCYRVAGTVGLMMCQVLDVRDEAALRHALDLGIGMQLTNICRDVSEDARAGRRYLPASRIGALAPQQLIDPAASLQAHLRCCVAELLEQADAYYRSGEQGLPYLPLRARAAILVAARLYRAIGVHLQRIDYAFWRGRAVVPARTKAALTLHALLTSSLTPGFWRSKREHDTALHSAFSDLPHALPRDERPHGR
ncbi:phytoene/squalene synthase family protein [Glaciimonas immobilis]|uniref:Phytoene synthase n=1 Tax=Glaciimonas immobilis TaxID=728004 RepID=A0A840RPP6_9BURK|nr:phytoene/squalene synthase family protein [Glaciimonas immobilis]KAF3996892.1 phytoene/squalene synthase family protein [Glaciimonas immobilis]MBB5199705.1 phytoene synthase [Glaciimonas immobilis]